MRFKKTCVKTFIAVLIVLPFYVSGDGFHTLDHIRPSSSADTQQKAVYDLIKRILPSRYKDFLVKINPYFYLSNGKDVFTLQTLKNGSILISGNNGVAASTGFNHYLKYHCNNHVSWEGSQLNLPKILPNVSVVISFNDRFRYYQNVCTTSYSFVWWKWKDWEKHIDWMAMNGYNLVLAFNGQEAIWKKVYSNLGLTEKEIDEHFAGPAFLSWSRMGNIRGWGGPLPGNWHYRSLILQKQILSRMRELGIIAVLPGFSGHVPRAFSRLYPKAHLTKVGKWNHFNDTYCCPFLIDPTDDLFQKVGTAFLKEIISEFGTDHVYNSDTFNEMVPPSGNLTYLSKVGRSIYHAMTTVDSEAIWMLQGWMFHSEEKYWTAHKAKAFLQSIPLGKMIVLDLQSEQFPQYKRLENYFGQPYIWCMLQNFGGTLGLLGSVHIVNNRVFEARNSNKSTMVGTGLTPEGINQNYVMYELMSEMAWRKKPTILTEWFNRFTERRYGCKGYKTELAWQLLKNSVYNYTELLPIRGKYAITRSPRTKITTWSWYNTSDVVKAWDFLLDDAKQMEDSSLYKHDVVDVTRQVLQNLGDSYYNKIIWAYRNKKVDKLNNYSKTFLEIFDDMDKILATNEMFLLGRWLNSAKNVTFNTADQTLYEYNARNQITLWGPNGEIKDYACKQWSGLMLDYYKRRWELFLKVMNKAISGGKKFQEGKAQKRVFEVVEKPFTFDRKIYPENPKGDSVSIALDLRKKWLPILKRLDGCNLC